MTRKTYVYRLTVTLPPEAADPSWEPDCWADELESDEFRWPMNRLFLSASGAKQRAELLRKYGAEVTIRRSAPVVWPQDRDAATGGED